MQNTQRTGNLLIGQKCGASVKFSPSLTLLHARSPNSRRWVLLPSISPREQGDDSRRCLTPSAGGWDSNTTRPKCMIACRLWGDRKCEGCMIIPVWLELKWAFLPLVGSSAGFSMIISLTKCVISKISWMTWLYSPKTLNVRHWFYIMLEWTDRKVLERRQW